MHKYPASITATVIQKKKKKAFSASIHDVVHKCVCVFVFWPLSLQPWLACSDTQFIVLWFEALVSHYTQSFCVLVRQKLVCVSV